MPAPRISRTVARPKHKPDFRRRLQHLTFIRLLPCVACGKGAPSEAAHVRTGTDGGTGMKPGDRYAVPLCTTCHAKQHRIGELSFWFALRIDPLNAAARLWTISGDVKAGERTVFRARQHIDLATAAVGPIGSASFVFLRTRRMRGPSAGNSIFVAPARWQTRHRRAELHSGSRKLG